MSALITASTQYLSGDLGAGVVDTSDNRLIAVWLKWVGTGNHNSENNGFYFRTASGNAYMSVTGDSTPLVVGKADHPNSGVSSTSAGTMTENAWFLAGIYVSAENVGFSTAKVYRDASSATNGFSASAVTTTDMREMFLGQSSALGGFSFWKGRIAEASVWNVANETEADAIMAELLTTPADAVTGGYTPLFYASLESGVTAEIGSALTNNGTVTFDAGDHPTLSGGGDTTAPTLTSTTGTATGSTTATGSVTTDEANGTLYRLASTNATETAATVIAAALSQTVTATGAQAVSFTGLTASTTYYAHYVHVDAASNQSARVSSSSFTTDTPDTTAPTLSSPTATVLSNALIAAGVTTNEANGTLYVVATTSATPPTATQIRAGQDHAGAAAVFAANQAISSTGDKTFNVTGLTQLTLYYLYFHHQDAAANNSTVSSASGTTFKDGATGQAIVDDTAAIPGVQEEGILFNDVELPADADKWFTYDVVTPVVDTASLTLFPNGSFIWTGTSADSFTYQLKVDGVDVGSPQLVTLTPSGPPDEILPELVGEITVTNLTTTSYDLSWPTGTDDTGVTGYEYSLNGGADWTSNGTDTTESVTGRTPGATDQVRVRCFDTAGNRSTPALSEAVTLLTPPPDPTPSNATKRTPNGMIGFWNR